jgi:hypothetical protein
MVRYRMYLVDRFGKFRWPHDLNAQNDGDALALVHAMQHACSDMPVTMELWQGARRIPGVSGKTPSALKETWEDMLARRQEALLETAAAGFRSASRTRNGLWSAVRLPSAPRRTPPQFAPK